MQRRFFMRCSWSLLLLATLWAMSARHAKAAESIGGNLDVRTGELKQALSDFLKVKKYLEDFTAARERGESVKPPSLNRILGSESTLKRLDDLLKSIENFSIAAEVAPGTPAAPTLGGILSAKKDSELRQVVHAGVLYLAERYKRAMELQDTGERLGELQKTAEAVRDATIKIRDMFVTLGFDVPVPFYYETFGFAAVELETLYIPKISAIATEAKTTGDRIAKELETRLTHMTNLGGNLYTLLDEEGRRLNERKEALLQRAKELNDLKVAQNAEIDEYNEKVKQFKASIQPCLKHNEKVRAYEQARAQVNAEMNADLYGGGLWYGKYEQRLRVLDAQDAALTQQANALKSRCSGIDKRVKEFDAGGEQIEAGTREYSDTEQRWQSDKRAYNEHVKTVEADFAWLDARWENE
jgi:hypothetical protein